jgi:hypothetical protein
MAADVLPHGAILLVAAVHRHGVALQLAVAHQVGEEVVVAERLAGVETAVAQLMVVAMEAGLRTVVMAREQLMVEQPRMAARLHMADQHHTEATMAHAPRMEASMQATARLLGEAHPVTLPNHLVVSLPPLLVHTMHPHRARMRLQLLVLTAHIQHLHLVGQWTRQRLATTLLLHQEILDTSTARPLQLHPHQGPGVNQRRPRRVEKTLGTIEVAS